MDLLIPMKKKIHAMDMYKRLHFQDYMYFYFLTVLTCSVFYCIITFCCPYLSSLVKVVFFVLVPGFVCVLLSSKILFILSNLIILVIVVDSRIFSPHDYTSATHVYLYEEYVNRNQTQWPEILTAQFKRSKKQENKVAEKVKKKIKEEESEEQSVVFASDELNKRADEFIERVLKQRRLELNHLKRDSFSLEYN